MKLYIQLFVAIITAAVFVSCKKKNTPMPEPLQQKTYLVKETRGATVTLDYKYDNQNRFTGHIYRDASNHQETFTTQYHSSGQPSELILRDYTFSKATKYNYTYDASNRCIKTELSDSANPTSYILKSTYDFTYTPTKITRTITNNVTSVSTRADITINAAGNITKEEFYKADGTKNFEYTYTAYDDKKNPRSATFPFVVLYPSTPNNNTAYQGGLVGGTVNSYTSTHTYNNDGYPTQTVWNNGVTYNYTYIKR
jgi:hypothetical protein